MFVRFCMSIERIWVLMARKLANEATESELQELTELLRHHPNEHYTIDIIQEQWKLGSNYMSIDAKKSFEKAWDKIQQQELPKSKEQVIVSVVSYIPPKNTITYLKKWGYSVAAAMFITGGIWLFFSTPKKIVGQPKLDANEISTKYGSKTKLILPDSTQVWLNAGSKLSYSNDYGETVREVKLVGEAYFDVTHNANKPFIIHTDKMDIKVLGTAFNVKCYPNEKSMEASLFRGSIEVTLKNRQSQKIILKPNEKLVLNTADTLLEKQPFSKKNNFHNTQEPVVAIEHVMYYDEQANAAVESSWVENKLIFRAETFEELAMQMERWYGVQIHFQNNALKQIKLTGIFERETINQAMAYLQLTAHFKYNMQNDSINIYL